MKIFCMSDIHGFYQEFEDALSLISDRLDDEDAMLLLLGDYIHGGKEGIRVLQKIISMQDEYGAHKIVALIGDHESMVLSGAASLSSMNPAYDDDYDDINNSQYIRWIEDMPEYYQEGNTIFVHAGIDESTGDMWELETSEDLFLSKYPAQTGRVPGVKQRIVAGHISTSEISGNPLFHDIYFDGESHYYIDGNVEENGLVNILMVDTDTDEYFSVNENGLMPVLPYDSL